MSELLPLDAVFCVWLGHDLWTIHATEATARQDAEALRARGEQVEVARVQVQRAAGQRRMPGDLVATRQIARMADDIPILRVPAGSVLRDTAYLTAGWLPLVEDLFAELDQIIPGFTIFDLSQKFKGLDVSPRIPDGTPQETIETVREAIEDARLRSLRICDFCGAEVEPSEGGRRTRCETHRSVGAFPDRAAPVRLVVRGVGDD